MPPISRVLIALREWLTEPETTTPVFPTGSRIAEQAELIAVSLRSHLAPGNEATREHQRQRPRFRRRSWWRGR
jgi:hypothetical protein